MRKNLNYVGSNLLMCIGALILCSLITGTVLFALWFYNTKISLPLLEEALSNVAWVYLQVLAVLGAYYFSKFITNHSLKEYSNHTLLLYVSTLLAIALISFVFSTESLSLFLRLFLILVFPALYGVRNAIFEFKKSETEK